MYNPFKFFDIMENKTITTKLVEAQAVNTIRQIERLTQACYIDSEDSTEPVWQEFQGSLYFDYEVRNLDPATMFHLGAMLASQFGAAAINTMLAKSTQKYRGYLRIEIQVPIKNK